MQRRKTARVNAEESGARRKPLYSAPVPFAGPLANATLYDVLVLYEWRASSLAARAQSAVNEIDDEAMRRACCQLTSHEYGLLHEHDSRVTVLGFFPIVAKCKI